ncbi:MAG TPA: hypothetical protein VL199_07610 [Burkholderiales bacterium]|jgi:hypothetical protein|nr:hypothetical protein [Burkholderiales bacterium]
MIRTLLITVTAAVLVGALLGGCASTAADCGGDWFAIGARDGRLGARPQADIYGARCIARVDTARYMTGWEAGFAERPVPLW